MRKWFFEVRDGRLSTLTTSLKRIVEEQNAAGAVGFFVSEGGTLLNEPDERIVVSIPPDAKPAALIA
jgi:hypothetical protein